MGVEQLQSKLRELSKLSLDHAAVHNPIHDVSFELTGYSGAKLSLIVCKKANPEFILDQVDFMRYLGYHVCPKILAVNSDSYNMEYLQPPIHQPNNLLMQETLLQRHVWNRDSNWIVLREKEWRTPIQELLRAEIPNWALGSRCVIHGDPTCDNLLYKDGGVRITDPIPPKWLRKPSIQAVDHGKMLQSFLGWETVLRGSSLIEYEWPFFMQYSDLARPAIFWAMISMKRICLRNYEPRITLWAALVAGELEKLCEL